MKLNKVRLLGNPDNYIYIVARKLHRTEPTNSDWVILSVHTTVPKAYVTMKKLIENSRQFKEKETYGILSIADDSLVLLKSERA